MKPTHGSRFPLYSHFRWESSEHTLSGVEMHESWGSEDVCCHIQVIFFNLLFSLAKSLLKAACLFRGDTILPET